MVGGEAEETLRELARESGRTLAELGVRAGDDQWIRQHAETIASLARRTRRLSWRLLGRVRGRERRDPSPRSG